MSLLWRDEVSIYVAPRRIALARRSRGLKPRVLAATEVEVDDGNAALCSPTLRRLAELLQDSAWQGADARVIIADAWVRFCIVPPPPPGLNAVARRAHARFVLADTYGDGVADWDVALEDSPPGRDAVASAMFVGLQQGLRAVLDAARLRLVFLQPQLVVAFNAWRRALPDRDAWFVTLRDGWLAAAHLSSGVWDRVYTTRLSSHAIVELERLRAMDHFTRASIGAGAARMFIEAPTWLRSRLSRFATDVDWLETFENEGGPAHELELLMRVGT